MDGGSSGGAAGGGGGPAPFLLKTYEMVDDMATDAIVSWSGSRKSFVVWNPPEFARVLLPSYFKHNNFSSFIRQLNTYGFRKIDPERWEFANEDFMKDQKHLLKNIHRRKPIHSHSNPPGSVDQERAAFEEEIDKLSREKSELEGNLLGYKEQQSAAKVQLETLTPRIGGIEQRQERLLTFLEKAVQNPEFVERLAQKLESMDFSAYNKKRRLPQVDPSQPMQENVLVDNQRSSQSESVNFSNRDFCDKLRLELSPAVSDINLLSHSTQSSDEDGISPQERTEGWSKDVQVRTETFLCPRDTLDLSDTVDSSLSRKSGPESQKLHDSASNDDADGHISCLLNLTLASSPLKMNKSRDTIGMHFSSQENRAEPKSDKNSEDVADRASVKDKTISDDSQALTSAHDVDNNNKQVAATAQNRVNDVFWEQFLTERPGCTDTEETSSSYRANRYDYQDDRKSAKGVSRNTKSMEHLSL